MKQVEIVTSKVEMLVVDLPRDATTVTSTDKNGNSNYFDGIEWRKMYLPEGNWQHLGKKTEFTEEDWKGVVESWAEVVEYEEGTTWYKNYEDYFGEYTLNTATESGLSLLKANGVVLENELGGFDSFDKSVYNHTKDRLKNWQQAESKVWRNCHVFIKQK